MTLPADLEFIIRLSGAAGQVARDLSGRVERLTKRGSEAVTAADRACQRLIVSGLRERFPDDGVIGEESDTDEAITNRQPRAGQRVWVIDPIDGTNNFVAGLGNCATCIGLLDGGQPVLGVVHDIGRGQTYAAARGAGAWLDQRPLAALDTPLGDSSLLMLTSNLLDAQGRLPAWGLRWHSQTRWKVRILGSAALEAVQVAAGVAHGAVTVNGKLWDLAAAAAVALEAGGLVTDLAGRPIFPYDLTGYSGAKVPFLVATPQAQRELLTELGVQ
jgi:myo-inositol-1(or 4)-monophosphatase